ACAAGIRRKHDESDALHPVVDHRMGTELVVEAKVIALAQEIEIVIGQDWRKPIGVFELDHVITEPGAQLVVRRAVGHASCAQSPVLDALEFACTALAIDRKHFFGIGEEGTDDPRVALDMWPEVAERVRVAPLDHGISFWRKRSHAATPSARERIREAPARGTRNQCGRCASSYSIS